MIEECRDFYQFCKEKLGSISLIYIATLLLYLPKMANFNYSIDSEHMAVNAKAVLDSWIGIGRFGLVLLKRISLYGIDINVFFINAGTYLLLATSGVLLLYLIHKMTTWPGYIQVFGVLIYTLAPVHFEQTNFILQSSEVMLAYNLLFMAFILLGRLGDRLNWHKILVAILFTTVSFSIYPSLIVGFLTLTVISSHLSLLDSKNQPNFIGYWISFKNHVLVFFSSFFIYQLLNRLFIKLYHTKGDSYITGASAWLKNSFGETFEILKGYFKAYYLSSNQPFHFELLTYLMVIAIVLLIITGVVEKRLKWFVILNLIWEYLLAISLLLILGSTLGPVRTMTPTVPLVMMTEVMTIMVLLRGRIFRGLGVGLAIVMVLMQLKTTSDLEQTEIVTYQTMANYSSQMVHSIKQLGITQSANYKLVVVGTKRFTSPMATRGEVIGTSFYNWDQGAPMGNNVRIHDYLASTGVLFQPITINDYNQGVQESATMAYYPAKDSIRIIKNKIIVKIDD